MFPEDEATSSVGDNNVLKTSLSIPEEYTGPENAPLELEPQLQIEAAIVSRCLFGRKSASNVGFLQKEGRSDYSNRRSVVHVVEKIASVNRERNTIAVSGATAATAAWAASSTASATSPRVRPATWTRKPGGPESPGPAQPQIEAELAGAGSIVAGK
jgi:hypothetical protein